MLVYGVLLGLAGSSAAALGYILHLEHVGWAAGAALLVMRPVRTQLVLRSIGRAASVLIGAFAAAAFAVLAPTPLVLALVVGFVMGALAATTASRWYIAPGFTTFIALTLIIHANTGVSAAERFWERTLETLLGVGLALLFGAVVPAIIAWMRKSRGRFGPIDAEVHEPSIAWVRLHPVCVALRRRRRPEGEVDRVAREVDEFEQ